MAWSTRVAGALLLAWFVAPAAAFAQLRGPQFGVGASATFPVGDFHADVAGDGYKVGWQGMALVAFRGRRSPVGLEIDGIYGENAANDSLNTHLTSLVGSPTTSKVKFLGADVDFTVTLPSRTSVKPYLLGGFGLYKVTISATSGGTTADTSGVKFAWNLGGGFTVGMRGAALFFEMRYVHVDAIAGFPKTPFFPITAGFRFGGW